MHRLRRPAAGAAALVLTLAGVTACGGGSSSGTAVGPTTSPAPATATDWTVRTDGAVYGSPIAVGSTVIAATEGGTVLAVDAASGRTVWSKHLADPVPQSALPCGNIDPLGITGRPVYDPASGRVFVVAETRQGGEVRHRLFGLAARDGAVQVNRLLPPPKGDERVTQQRPALLVTRGRVYVAFGGLYGDCGTYFGAIVSSRTDGTGPLDSVVPASASGKGAIWAPPGPTLTPQGNLLVAVGNGDATAEPYDGSDSVVALRPDLSIAASFHPDIWADDNRRDLDLGSSSPAVVGDHVVQIGKRGVLYVLRRTDLVTEKQLDLGSGGYGGDAVSRTDAGDTVFLPLTSGLTAVTIAADGTPTRRWSAPVKGTPVIAGPRVLAIEGRDSSVLRSYDAATGAPGPSYTVPGAFTRFAAPTVVGGRAYVGTTTGYTALTLR